MAWPNVSLCSLQSRSLQVCRYVSSCGYLCKLHRGVLKRYQKVLHCPSGLCIVRKVEGHSPEGVKVWVLRGERVLTDKQGPSGQKGLDRQEGGNSL